MNVPGRGRNSGLGPSNPAATPRAVLLIAVAVVLGAVLLWKGVDSEVGTVAGPEAPAADETPLADEQAPADEGGADSAADTTDDVAAATTTAVATTTTSSPLFPTRPAYEVKVLVANGSGIGGAAGAVTGILNPHGYALESPANANRTDVSGIYYRTGFADDARMVMEIVAPGSPNLLSQMPTGGLSVPDSTLDRLANADIVLILGADGVIYSG